MDPLNNRKRRVLSVFVLAMLNVSMMASLRNLPLVSSYGLSAVVYFSIVAILFLIPLALVSAELATGWPKSGGIYIWIREALGDKWGFFAVWVQWSHSLPWYPVILSFVATTLAYVVDPTLAQNRHFILGIILFFFWGMTALNYLGIRTSSLFSTIGVILGTIIPGTLIILLGILWTTSGNPLQITFSANQLLPDVAHLDHLVFLAGMFLAFAGLEVTAAHAAEVENPQKNYPKSIVIAAIITFLLFMLGSLSIATVIPKNEISLVAGLMEAFQKFFDNYHMGWFLPIMGIMLVLGAIAEVNAWIIGPLKALHETSLHGNLPQIFQKVNSRGVPTNLLLFQAIIVSLASLVFLHMPSISSSYWILSALAAQSYLIMYVLMFISAIRLRYSKPHVPRAYRVPYQAKGMWFLASLGILSSLFGILISFIPPEQLQTGKVWFYESFLVLGLIVICALPLGIHTYLQKKGSKPLA